MPRFVLQLGTQLSLTARRTQRTAACSLQHGQNAEWCLGTSDRGPSVSRLRHCGCGSAARRARLASRHAAGVDSCDSVMTAGRSYLVRLLSDRSCHAARTSSRLTTAARAGPQKSSDCDLSRTSRAERRLSAAPVCLGLGISIECGSGAETCGGASQARQLSKMCRYLFLPAVPGRPACSPPRCGAYLRILRRFLVTLSQSSLPLLSAGRAPIPQASLVHACIISFLAVIARRSAAWRRPPRISCHRHREQIAHQAMPAACDATGEPAHALGHGQNTLHRAPGAAPAPQTARGVRTLSTQCSMIKLSHDSRTQEPGSGLPGCAATPSLPGAFPYCPASRRRLRHCRTGQDACFYLCLCRCLSL